MRQRKLFTSILTLIATVITCTSFDSGIVQAAPSYSGSSKIHFITLPGNTDAILLESDGKFGMVDSGEDHDYPDGSDSRYPDRPGIIKNAGYEDIVISYLSSLGVDSSNFEFYIGTHPHSDHIGSADEIIREFHPKRVYIQEYKDSYISNSGNLWDNLYVYDHMIEAAQETGATLIQSFAEDAPLYPEKVSVTGSITWDDDSNASGSRPSSVTVQVTRPDSSDTVTAEVTPEEESDLWSYSIEDLPKYDDKKEPISYTIQLETPDNYTVTTENGYDFICTASEKNQDSTPWNLSLPKEGGVYDDTDSVSFYSAESDNMETSDIPETDQVDPSNPLDPNNNLESEGVASERTGMFDDFSGHTSTPSFTLGDMQIQIMHYGTDYMTNPKPDANYFSLGVKVSVNGKTAFLAGDINNYEGAETALAEELGQVDILKLGHHGFYGSNTWSYLQTLSPQIAIMTGNYSYVSSETSDDEISTLDALLNLSDMGTTLYATDWYTNDLPAIVINMGWSLSTNTPTNKEVVATAKNNSPYTRIYYLDGLATAHTGFVTYQNNVFLFEDSRFASSDKWAKDDSGNSYYFTQNGNAATGWLTQDNIRYYFNSNGIMQTGWADIDNNRYYFESSGKMVTGKKKINGDYYYFDTSGAMVRDTYVSNDYYDENGKLIENYVDPNWKHNAKGWWYQLSDGSYPKSQWMKIHGLWYYFDSSGYRVTGWFNSQSNWYYFNQDGVMQTGWITVNKERYYLNTSGKMVTGWLKDSGKWYFLNKSSGKMMTGWLKDSGKWYFLEKSSGKMMTGWLKDENNWYYLNADGAMTTGWQTVKNKIYYLDSNGIMVSNKWCKNGKWYYLTSSGAAATGWLKLDGIWYYFNSDSTMATGWLKLDQKTYYLKSSGAMVTGWLKISGKWYYFNKSGVRMESSWIDDKYYVDENGVMLTNTTTPDGYQVDKNGVKIKK